MRHQLQNITGPPESIESTENGRQIETILEWHPIQMAAFGNTDHEGDWQMTRRESSGRSTDGQESQSKKRRMKLQTSIVLYGKQDSYVYVNDQQQMTNGLQDSMNVATDMSMSPEYGIAGDDI